MTSREIYPKDAVRALQKLGFLCVRKKGSHMRLCHSDGRCATIAVHSKPLSFGTLHSILKQAGIARRELEKKL